MDFKELNLKELQHEHPLTLVDLQLMHREYEEDDEDYDEKELMAMQNFECTCERCGRRIDWYHRYYYKCSMSSTCNYSVHKFCEEITTTLKFEGHPSHNLILRKTTDDKKCNGCLRSHRDDICYHCPTCNYGIDLLCATFVEQNTVHYPGHLHPLIYVSAEPGLNKCFACEKKHEGRFYHCTTCFNFSINSNCLSLPIKLSLETEQFSHRHLLTISYTFLDETYDCECRICGKNFKDEHLIYKCSKCMYYVHSDCATQRIEPFMSILLPGLGKTQKNFKDVDHPNLVHLPLFDESHNILSHMIEGKSCDEQLIRDANNHLLIHSNSHEHPLVLINNMTSSSSSMIIKLHDPMKRVKVLCNGCSRPITKIPFYKSSKDDEFVLHDWCATRLPKKLRNHVGHPGHTLILVKNDSEDVFECSFCSSYCNGFSYICSNSYCYLFSNNAIFDVNCAFIPEEITHEAHADHLLTRVDQHHTSSSHQLAGKIECRACRVSIAKSKIYFRCATCDFYLDCQCALHLPKTIRHKLDKHTLELSYGPIEDHKSEYFCEVCEEGLDPRKWFYHCVECAQSIHSACAPLILQSEQDINSRYLEGVYKLINIKFGAVRKQNFHRHPMLFAPGTENDGLCRLCNKKLKSNAIWKCLHCTFAVHYYDCFRFRSRGKRQGIFPWPEGHIIDGNKRMIIKNQPQTNIEFYPSEIIRPKTRHWKVVDNMML